METENAVLPVSRSSALATFKAAVGHLSYKPKAVFPSEMFLFYLQAQDFGEDDLILESGVGFGGSTTYLVELFPKTTIASVDSDAYQQLQFFMQRMKRHKNLHLTRGDALRLLPLLAQRARADRIAVLIDGPKRMAAVSLASKMLQDSRVKFVAVHDLPDEMARLGHFHSHDSAWRKAYGFLDEKVGEFRKYYPKGPGLTIFKKI